MKIWIVKIGNGNYSTNSKTFFDYNSRLISRIVDEKKDEDIEQKSLRELFKEKYPNKAADFDDDCATDEDMHSNATRILQRELKKGIEDFITAKLEGQPNT